MAEEGRGVALAILGVVAVIAVVGLVLLFKGGTGQYVYFDQPKVYPGKVVAGEISVPTSQSYGEGNYASEQQGSCIEGEMFIQGAPYDPQQCRPGEMRISVYQRNRKFFGAPDYTDVVEGYCCPQPYNSYPEGTGFTD
jgi:hypothetical protein